MSPFIVTTTRPHSRDEVLALREHGEHGPIANPRVLSQLAVATLDKARNQAYDAVWTALPRACGYPSERAAALDAIDILPESGGTVGPLPDVTTIQVEPVTWFWLAREAGHLLRYAGAQSSSPIPTEDVSAAIIAAFNAKQAGQDAVSKRT